MHLMHKPWVTCPRLVIQVLGPHDVEVVVQDQKDPKQVTTNDLAWMGDYQSAESLFSQSVLPANHPATLFSRVFR